VAINKIHPESFRIHSPAWNHQELFTAGRALERSHSTKPVRNAKTPGTVTETHRDGVEMQLGDPKAV